MSEGRNTPVDGASEAEQTPTLDNLTKSALNLGTVTVTLFPAWELDSLKPVIDQDKKTTGSSWDLQADIFYCF